MKTQALARLKATAAPPMKLKYLHDLAINVFGPKIRFDPVDTVSISEGEKHFDIYTEGTVSLKTLNEFSNLAREPGTDHLKVESVVLRGKGSGGNYVRVLLA